MSTTSVAVVYAVMLEFGLNGTDYGKVVLAACFITDLATVVALGVIFAPFRLGRSCSSVPVPWRSTSCHVISEESQHAVKTLLPRLSPRSWLPPGRQSAVRAAEVSR
jgi:hypothetical protein